MGIRQCWLLAAMVRLPVSPIRVPLLGGAPGFVEVTVQMAVVGFRRDARLLREFVNHELS